MHLKAPHTRDLGSSADTSEFRTDTDSILIKELRPIYTGVPGFFEAFFGEVEGLQSAAEVLFQMCKGGDNPHYREGEGWRDWPQSAEEGDVLKWLTQLTNYLLNSAEMGERTQRRTVIGHGTRLLRGSTATRKLDIGFVREEDAAEQDADESSKFPWAKMLVPAELKSNANEDTEYKTIGGVARAAREVFFAQDSRRFVLAFTLCGPLLRLWEIDRLGAIASEKYDIHKEGLILVRSLLGFLWMNDEQLGFDPTIITTTEGTRYIEIDRNGQRECLVLDKLIMRVACTAGRATTCWKAYLDGDSKRKTLIIKDSWQFPEREVEGDLLREATDAGVINVARHYYHETVRVSGSDDDVCENIRRRLDLTKAENYKTICSKPVVRREVGLRQQGGRRQNSKEQNRSKQSAQSMSGEVSSKEKGRSPNNRKRINRTNTPPVANRVHRRVILCDYGKAIYKASTRARLLDAFKGCIDGYESLYSTTGILQGDISKNNLLINEDDDEMWASFLIDLDFAIRKEAVDEAAGGAHNKTGTRPFMAIGVLYGETHSFMHDLESFFWVLFWICVNYDGPGEKFGPSAIENWNYMNDTELGIQKTGLISNEADFLGEVGFNFTEYYRPLLRCVNRLRREVFPRGQRWQTQDIQLCSRMREILQNEIKEGVDSEASVIT
ncbi:MAG: hypothetical protein M1825_004294 [Sarcosagium campestre]|nr:MAG: hypothetical protein M1825_004294 [Sarcosagium campestre]